MKHKLKFKNKCLYSPSENYWAFVRKIRGGFEVLGTPQSCKDYMHDALSNVVHKKALRGGSGYNFKSKINLKQLQFVMFFNKIPGKKEHVYSTKRTINKIEKKYGIKSTTILEVDSCYKEEHAFIITTDKIYLESPALMHGLVAFMRTMHNYETTITHKNLSKILETGSTKDKPILKYVVKYNIMGLLMKHHNEIFKGLTLEDIYPKDTTNPMAFGYHSSFGMVALGRCELGSKVYSDKICAILKKNKIPVF